MQTQPEIERILRKRIEREVKSWFNKQSFNKTFFDESFVEYEKIKDSHDFDLYQSVLYRFVDDNTRFPKNLKRVSVYSMSFIEYIPNPENIVELRVRCPDIGGDDICMKFINLESLYMYKPYEQSVCVRIIVPPKIRKLYISGMKIIYIKAKDNSYLTKVYAPDTYLIFEGIGKLRNLKKIACYNTNFIPSESLAVFGNQFPSLKRCVEHEVKDLCNSYFKLSNNRALVFPSTLKELHLEASTVPVDLPSNLESFSIGKHFDEVLIEFPKTLKKLDLSLKECQVLSDVQRTTNDKASVDLSNLKNLKILRCLMCDSTSISNSENIEDLTISDIPMGRYPKLKSLYIIEPVNCEESMKHKGISNIKKAIKETIESMQNLEEFCYLGPESDWAQIFIDFVASMKNLKKLYTTLIPKTLSQSIEELMIIGDYSSILRLPQLNNGLKKLKILILSSNLSSGYENFKLGPLPDTIEDIKIESRSILPRLHHELPKSLKKLILIGNYTDDPYELRIPDNIKKLIVPFEIYKKLPDSIEYLSARSLKKGIKIPSNLKVLILEKCKKVPSQSDSLETLKINRCTGAISKLPKNLRVLEIHKCTEILSFPKYIEKIKIDHFKRIQEIRNFRVFETEEEYTRTDNMLECSTINKDSEDEQ
jgi:hypothetical protein